MAVTTYHYNLMLKGKAMGSISVRMPGAGPEKDPDMVEKAIEKEIVEELFPGTHRYSFVLYKGEETEERFKDDYENGLIMYAMRCTESEAHPCVIEDEDGMEWIIDKWAPHLYIEYSHDGVCDYWQESYPDWGDAMRDAEAKWEMLPEEVKKAVLSKDGATFMLTEGSDRDGVVRDWAVRYIPADVFLPRNRTGIRTVYWNPKDDDKLICHVLVPIPEEHKRVMECRISMRDYLRRIAVENHLDINLRMRSDRGVPCHFMLRAHDEGDGPIDYDGFMPLDRVHHVSYYLPRIKYFNDWICGCMTFIDDGELDRALEANKDWLEHMNVCIERLEDNMRRRPDVFEGTFFGDVWVWEHTY